MSAIEHKLPSKDRILLAARKLFGENGFHRTSMSELAAGADMSVGLIYRSFKSKEEIIEAIVCADFDRKLAEFESLRQRLWTCNGFVPVTYLIKPPWLRRRAG